MKKWKDIYYLFKELHGNNNAVFIDLSEKLIKNKKQKIVFSKLWLSNYIKSYNNCLIIQNIIKGKLISK